MLTTRLARCLYAATAVAIASSACDAQTNARTDFPPLGHLVDVGGYRVHLYCTGSGSPTVVIVGAGFSFDWGLVQPDASRSTRVCTYDPSGTAWSDPGPTPTCTQRVDELHALLTRGQIEKPVVLVGHSIGGIIERLYASRYPDDVAGMVIVDHAATIRMSVTAATPGFVQGTVVPGLRPPGSAPVLPPSGLRPMAFEEYPAFKKLPAYYQQLHRWAVALPNGVSPGAQRRLYDQCFADVEATTRERLDAFGKMPLVVISSDLDAPDYVQLQKALLALSHSSQQLIAAGSGHAMTIDRPEVIVDGIHRVVEAVRQRIVK